MTNAVYRRCAAGAAVLTLTLGLTGCGAKGSAAVHAPAGGNSERTGGAQKPGTKKSAPRVRVLTQDQLERAVVNEHDLPGLRIDTYGVGTEGWGDGIVKPFSDSDTRPAACAPLSAAVDGGSRYTPVGSVLRSVWSKGSGGLAYLVSYQDRDAVRVMDDLRTALRTCKDFTAGPMKVAYKGVRPADDPSQGDEGVSFGVTELLETPGHDDPVKIPRTVVVIRSGSTVAVFTAIESRPRIFTFPKVPADVVTAQSKVLSTGIHAAP